MDKLKGADEVAADTYKMVLLKDWDAIRENVKKGLKRLGLGKIQSWKMVMNL